MDPPAGPAPWNLRIIVVGPTTPVERNHTPTTTSRWLQGLCRNDAGVVQELYDLHFPGVRHFVLQNRGTANDAQDVFQEAMTVLWLNAREGRVTASEDNDLGGYLFRVARNKWLDTVRSAAHRNGQQAMDSELVAGTVADTAESEVEDRIAGLRAIYARLDERCRLVLDRFYYQQQDLAAIATELGVDEGSIRTIKYRCMMKLRGMRDRISEVDGRRSEP